VPIADIRALVSARAMLEYGGYGRDRRLEEWGTRNEAMSYVLILTIITSFGGVDTQRQTGFDSYQSCAEHTGVHGECHDGP